ncbi:MAG: TorD/DmsD family molecular chaperone [Terriglobales bacterium]
MIIAAEHEVSIWLERATSYRFFSLYFRLPTEEVSAELAALAAEVSSELRELAKMRQQLTLEECAQEFHRVLGAGGIPACASSYDDNALAGRGPMLADISGFYQAFAYRPEPPPAEVPDHLAVELDFLSYLAVKVAFALHEGCQDEAEIARRACEQFLTEHLHEWTERFHLRLEQSASPIYIQASMHLRKLLSSQSASRADATAPNRRCGSPCR